MAQFRGTIQGGRGTASRLGTKKSGLEIECNGWNSGVSVHAVHNLDTGKDEFEIFATGGSGHNQGQGYLGKVVEGKFYLSRV